MLVEPKYGGQSTCPRCRRKLILWATDPTTAFTSHRAYTSCVCGYEKDTHGSYFEESVRRLVAAIALDMRNQFQAERTKK